MLHDPVTSVRTYKQQRPESFRSRAGWFVIPRGIEPRFPGWKPGVLAVRRWDLESWEQSSELIQKTRLSQNVRRIITNFLEITRPSGHNWQHGRGAWYTLRYVASVLFYNWTTVITSTGSLSITKYFSTKFCTYFYPQLCTHFCTVFPQKSYSGSFCCDID